MVRSTSPRSSKECSLENTAISFSESSFLGLIEFPGKGAKAFLQGQLTCDVNRLEVGHSCQGALCNNKGKVLATFVLYNTGESYLMRLARDLIPAILEYLQKFAVFFKCQPQILLNAYRLLFSFNQPLSEEQLPKDSISIQHTNDLQEIWLPEQSYALLVSQSGLTIQPDDPLIFSAFIQRGVPIITQATSDQFLAHALNLDKIGAISFTKGCYTGQEIIARTEYRGKPKRRARHLRLSQALTYQNGDTCTTVAGDLLELVMASPENWLCVAPLEMSVMGEIQQESHRVHFETIPLPFKSAAN